MRPLFISPLPSPDTPPQCPAPRDTGRARHVEADSVPPGGDRRDRRSVLGGRVTIEDRWSTTSSDPAGGTRKIKSGRHGQGLRWRVVRRDPSGQRRSSSFADHTDAWIFAHQALMEVGTSAGDR